MPDLRSLDARDAANPVTVRSSVTRPVRVVGNASSGVRLGPTAAIGAVTSFSVVLLVGCCVGVVGQRRLRTA